MIGWEREKKILLPNSIHTRRRQENTKQIPKKLKIIKNSLSDIWRKWDEIGRERGKKILLPYAVHTRLGKENPKKIVKKLNKLKNHFPTFFLAKMG